MGVYIGTNALFRESLVNMIFAICNLCARLFTVIAPIVASTKDKNNPFINVYNNDNNSCMLCFLALSLVGVMAASFINENKSRLLINGYLPASSS